MKRILGTFLPTIIYIVLALFDRDGWGTTIFAAPLLILQVALLIALFRQRKLPANQQANKVYLASPAHMKNNKVFWWSIGIFSILVLLYVIVLNRE
ncbi:MAG: hypothetical protein AAB619_02840 [Patescibacteria group bacterium]